MPKMNLPPSGLCPLFPVANVQSLHDRQIGTDGNPEPAGLHSHWTDFLVESGRLVLSAPQPSEDI